jgi:hypothetical protein
VVVSPSVYESRSDGTSNWVIRELEFFQTLPQRNRVTVALVGRLSRQDLPDTIYKLYPNITRLNFTAFRRGLLGLWTNRALRDELLTLLASLYQLQDSQVPVLRREEERRRTKRAWAAACLASILLVGMTGMATYANARRLEAERAQLAEKLARREAQTQRDEAERQKQVALAWSFAYLRQCFRPFHKGLKEFSGVCIQGGVAENPFLPSGVT